MAMATEPKVTRPLNWSTDTLEKRFLDALRDIHSQYLGSGDENYVLDDADLSGIIEHWGRRYKDTYDLHIDTEDDIKPASINTKSGKDAKILLVRCIKGRWQACCHFEEARTFVDTLAISSAAKHSPRQPSIKKKRDQRTVSAAPAVLKKHNSAALGVEKPLDGLDSATEFAVNVLNECVSELQNILLAAQREADYKDLRLSIDKMTASFNELARAYAQPHLALDKLPKYCGSNISTSTKHDLSTKPSSPVQKARAMRVVSDLDSHTDAVLSNPLSGT